MPLGSASTRVRRGHIPVQNHRPAHRPLVREADKLLWRRAVFRRVHDHATRGPVKVSQRSVRRWLRAYRRDGWNGLMPRVREKKGPKVLTEAALELLESLIRENPLRSTKSLLDDLAAKPKFKVMAKTVGISTVNRQCPCPGGLWSAPPGAGSATAVQAV